jgi:hypothetical protein
VAVPTNRRPTDPKWTRTSASATRSDRLEDAYLPRKVRMIDSTAGLSGAFGAILRKFSKYTGHSIDAFGLVEVHPRVVWA